jgi:hypothetical protein
MSEKQKRLISIMEQGIRRLLQMIAELWRSQAGGRMVDIRKEECGINDVVSGFISEISPTRRRRVSGYPSPSSGRRRGC